MDVSAAMQIEYYRFLFVLSRHFKYLHGSDGILSNLTRKYYAGRNLRCTLVGLVSHGLVVRLRVHLV